MSSKQEARTERRAGYLYHYSVPDTRIRAAAAATDQPGSAVCCALFEHSVDAFLRQTTDGEGDAGWPDERNELQAQTFEIACRLHRNFDFPDTMEAGLRIGQLGSFAVRFEVGLFCAGEDKAVATGHVVRVFISSANGKPASLPSGLRTSFSRFVVAA